MDSSIRRWISNLYQIRLLNTALILIRVWLGTIMLKHSSTYLFYGKVPELASFLESLNWPQPLLLAYASQITEFIAAVLILLGVRLGAWLMAFTLGIAVIFAHAGDIYSEAELPFNYFLFSLILSITGCGKPSLDDLVLRKKYFSS
jgi:uncharacterized membrane protein YphA (DoxX/SURF4 family)